MTALPPVVFIAHGAPSIALEEDDFTRALAAYGKTLATARAVVIVSAHWEAAAVRVNAVARPETIYDFGGFAPELYRIRYEAPGDAALAREVAEALGSDIALETQRGWDHGVWVPLRIALPDARIPIVEVAQPHRATPETLLRIGRALAPLRERGIVIAGSGGIVHNLRDLSMSDKNAPVKPWAKQFDDWFAERLEARDVDALLHYGERSPFGDHAAPTPEHLHPVFAVLGAATESDTLTTIYEGFHYGTLSMRTFAFS
jgi:4,5-DOPA dioxygenase extradiol